MRVVFVNLHHNEFFVKTSNLYLYKHSCAHKHRYLLNYLLDRPDVEVCTFINDYGFSLVQNFNKFAMFFLKMLGVPEHYYIMKKNNIPYSKIKVITNPKDIREDDLLISYLHHPRTLSQIADLDVFKAVSAIHFCGASAQEESDWVKSAKPNVIFNESDLKSCSDIFKKYFKWYDGDFIVHPFVAVNRFQRNKPFKQRENRVFSTGTITYKNDDCFISVYGDPCDQPIRKQILIHADELKQFVACYNAEYNEDFVGKTVKPSDSKIVKYYKVFYNRRHQGQQKKYFSFDMVERFNNFTMCLVGEEILGVPGIGFVEGMACGCAYLGVNNGLYEAYGMKEGVHYIGYDGSIEDLKKKVSYYQQQEHLAELERIAEAGYNFAKERFNSNYSAEYLYNQLVEKQKAWLETKQKQK